MDDLISEFFKRDLTEAESKALREKLVASPAEAVRFGEKAHQVYLLYGLPEPHLPGHNGPSHGPGGPSHGHPGGPQSGPLHPSLHWGPLALKPLLVATTLTALGGAGLVVWKQSHPVIPAVPLTPVAIPVAPPTALPTPSAERSQAPAMIPSTPVPQPTSTPTTVPIPLLTPVDISGQAHPVFSDLAVAVRRSSPGNVKVKVLTEGGQTLALLYEGMLNTGNWVFNWDGKLAPGRMAPPGLYQIQVESGPYTQKKRIVIR